MKNLCLQRCCETEKFSDTSIKGLCNFKKKQMEAVTEILNKVPELSYKDLLEIRDTINKVMVDKRREEIRMNAEQARKHSAEGKLKSFSDSNEMIAWLTDSNE